MPTEPKIGQVFIGLNSDMRIVAAVFWDGSQSAKNDIGEFVTHGYEIQCVDAPVTLLAIWSPIPLKGEHLPQPPSAELQTARFAIDRADGRFKESGNSRQFWAEVTLALEEFEEAVTERQRVDEENPNILHGAELERAVAERSNSL